MTEPDGVAWLNDEEQKTWLTYVRCSAVLMAGLDQQLRQDVGIPHSWYGLLTRLSDQNDGRARVSDLAFGEDFSLSRISHALTQMERRGWVVREPNEADKRVTDVVLTDVGMTALRQAAPGHVAAVRRLFISRLAPEQMASLRESCQTILDGLGEDSA